MDFQKLITRYRQFGGFRLVIAYVKLGALWPAIKAGIQCVVKRQSFKQIYPEVLRHVEPILKEKYAPVVSRFKFQDSGDYEHKRNKIIWFCWVQGIDQAPEIVHACYNSIKRNLPDREVKVIDGKNWKDYVELPEYIIEKWEEKRIPAALFSDLLRLELLIEYGGTWIDSTVLCTGFKEFESLSSSCGSSSSPSVQEFKRYLDADLFLFQYTKQGSIPVSISNWFITSCSNNDVLIVLRDMLYAYWKDYDCTLDYYIFHLFFSMLSKEYPEEIKAMPYGQSMNSLVLLHHMNEKFDQTKWEKLTSRVSFHKLAFRLSKDMKNDKNNYYNYILNTYYTN